jgi:hypothetical protein
LQPARATVRAYAAHGAHPMTSKRGPDEDISQELDRYVPNFNQYRFDWYL